MKNFIYTKSLQSRNITCYFDSKFLINIKRKCRLETHSTFLRDHTENHFRSDAQSLESSLELISRVSIYPAAFPTASEVQEQCIK